MKCCTAAIDRHTHYINASRSYRAMFSADGFFRIPTKPPAKSARQVRVEEEGGVVLSLATLAFVGAGHGMGGQICDAIDSFQIICLPFNKSVKCISILIDDLINVRPRCAASIGLAGPTNNKPTSKGLKVSKETLCGMASYLLQSEDQLRIFTPYHRGGAHRRRL